MDNNLHWTQREASGLATIIALALFVACMAMGAAIVTDIMANGRM